MSRRDHRLFLNDIVEGIERIQEYTSDMDYETFCADRKTVDAVVRNFEIIGEAAKNIPAEVKDGHPDVPWHEMAAIRDKVIHGYFDLIFSIIWETTKVDLPSLKAQIEEILNGDD